MKFVTIFDHAQKLRSRTLSTSCIKFSLEGTAFPQTNAFFLHTLNLTEPLFSALTGSTAQTHDPVLCYRLSPLEEEGLR
jgi:hypothetical protein